MEGYKFQFEGGRSVYYFLAHIIIEQYSVDDEEWSLGEVNVLSDCTNHNTKWMRIHKDQSEYEKALNTFLGDPELCDRLVRYLEEQRDIVTKRLQKTDFQGLSDDELKDLIDYTSHQCGKSLRPSIIIRMADLALIPRLMRMFADKKDRDELVAVASVSEEPSFTLSEEMDLLSLAMKMKNGKLEIDSGLVAGELSRIKDTYCFSEMGYFNERAKTIEDFKERLEEMIYGSPEERLEEIKSERKRLLEQKTAILKQVSKEDQQIIRIASRLSHIKDCCKAAINKVIYNTEPLFREIAAHTNETVKRIKDLSPEEIKQLVDKRPIKWETIQKRTDSHILITFKKKFYALTGQEAERFRRLYQEADRSRRSSQEDARREGTSPEKRGLC